MKKLENVKKLIGLGRVRFRQDDLFSEIFNYMAENYLVRYIY